MGSLLSSPERRYKLLIGSLPEDMPPQEMKLFSLSQFILNVNDSNFGKMQEPLGFKVIDQKPVSGQSFEYVCRVMQKMDNENTGLQKQKVTSVESGSDNKISATTETNTHCSDVLGEDTDFALFSVMVTDKPFYFSQTFSQWLTMHRFSNLCPPSCCQREKRKIYLQPVDSFPACITGFEIEQSNDYSSFFSLLQKFMDAYFDEMTVDILPDVNILEARWNIRTRVHRKTGTKQYFVQDFFPKLKKVMPTDGFCIMGMSWTDLYPTEQLNFVLGEAHYISRAGIFCFGRYEPKTYNPATHQDITEIDAKLMWRILKVISHETCHLFGLQHCWYFHCAMNESSSMAEAASQPLFLCPVCLRKLQYVCGFSVVHRYKKLLNILRGICKAFPSDEFQHSVKWLENCLVYLEKG